MDILLLIADDMHHGNDVDFGPHPAGAAMPELRKLKNEGQIMAEMPHGSVVCSTSRIATLTGRIPAKWGMYSTAGSALNTYSGIPDGVPTLFDQLMPLGYRCGLFGKNHTNETFPGVTRYGWANPDGAYVPASAATALAAPIESTDPIMRDTVIGNECASWIDDAVAASEPYFAMVGFHAPHYPLRPAQEHLDALSHLHGSWGRYYASLRQMDAAIKVIMDRVRLHGRPTLVFFFSDNAGLDPNGVTNVDQITAGGKFRGAKGDTGRGGTSGPGRIWGPQVGVPADVMNYSLFSPLDLMATINSMLGLPAIETDGEDMSAVITGQYVARTKPIYWYSAQPEAATKPAYHNFPKYAGLFEHLGLRAYIEPDGSGFVAYRLTDEAELDQVQNELSTAEVAEIVRGLTEFRFAIGDPG